MRKPLWGLAFTGMLCACSSNSDSGGGDNGLTISVAPAQGVAISEVAVFQTLKVSLAKDGAPVGDDQVPLVAHRDALVRVYVTPGDGWQSKSLSARLKIESKEGTETVSKIFEASATIDGASEDGQLASTINFDVPGDYILPDAQFAVVLFDPTQKGGNADESPARYPQKVDTLAPLTAQEGGEIVRVKVIPVSYEADGSGRLPDTSDEQIQKYTDRLYQLYPSAKIEVTVGDPFSWSQAITRSSGFDTILEAIRNLRDHGTDGADVYYYAAFAPARGFREFCQSACTTGLSYRGLPVSVGIGFTGDESPETMAHEVGHAHDLWHAPCGFSGGDSSVDPDFPNANASLGVWGYDQVGKALIDPNPDLSTPYADMMSYCQPTWISDYHYKKLFDRIRQDNHAAAARMVGAPMQYREIHVASDGTLQATGKRTTAPSVLGGERHDVRFVDGGGKLVSEATAIFYPYDHAPGGLLLVPDAPGAASSAEVLGVSGVASQVIPAATR